MNDYWMKYPQKAKMWNKDIDYYMFVDENGNSGNIQDFYNKLLNNKPINEDDKYFTLTGVIFDKQSYSIMRNNIRKLKEKYWKKGYYIDSKFNESRYVCLHSRDIRRHNGAFNDSIINYDDFIISLSNILKNIDCKIISVSINLEEYVRKGLLENVYGKAFDLLFERYIYATKNNKKGCVMLESRRKEEDKILLSHINEVMCKKGQGHVSSSEFRKKILGVYFNPKWYKGHSSTYCGLEVVDLFSYPIYKYVKHKKKDKAFEVIESKIVGFPNYNKKGIKIFP